LTLDKDPEGKSTLKWQSNKDKDFCYYRIYSSENPDFKPDAKNQLGSTIATEFLDERSGNYYKVLAVNQSGNVAIYT